MRFQLLLLLPCAALAAFLGQVPSHKLTSSTASSADTLRSGGSIIQIIVTGPSALNGAFVTLDTGSCVAKRDTSGVANASFFVPKGVIVERLRPLGAKCIAMTTSDTGSTATLRYETGTNASPF